MELTFSGFWTLYPRKVSRMMAEKAWRKLTPAEQQEALAALPNHIAYWKACETEKEFIPHPRTWIYQQRFYDEVELPQQKKPEVAWWGSEQMIVSKGQEVGILPRPGESIHQLKGRIVEKLREAA